MGIGDYVDKAKQALAGREDQVAGALDKAADAVKSRTGESTDRKIDSAVDKAKDFLAKQGEHGHRESGADHRATAHPDEHRPAGTGPATHTDTSPGTPAAGHHDTPASTGRHASGTRPDAPSTRPDPTH